MAEEVNEKVVEAMASVLVDEEDINKAEPIRHGDFNRRMFLTAIVLYGARGTGAEKESIMELACMTDREFDTIKTELIEGGVIKEKKNFCGVYLYSFNLD